MKELVKNGVIELKKVATCNNRADVLTKSLAQTQLRHALELLPGIEREMCEDKLRDDSKLVADH